MTALIGWSLAAFALVILGTIDFAIEDIVQTGSGKFAGIVAWLFALYIGVFFIHPLAFT